MKVIRSITIDKKVDEELKTRAELNVSSLCNRLLMDYLDLEETEK